MTLQVFISYKSEYREIAREVKRRLLEWEYETWLDVDSIAKGTYWPDEIDKGLISSDVLVGVVTKEAFDSRPIKLEWDYFLYEGKTILPCKYDDVKPPPRYITIQHIDFTKDKEKAFDELKERLTELAMVSSPTRPEPVQQEAEEVVLDDGLFGGAMMPVEDAPSPQPATPQPLEQQSPSGSDATLPATAPFQPSRQNQTMPQPAPLRRKRSSPVLWSLAAVASLVIIVGAVVLFGSNAAISTTTQFPQDTSPLVWIGVLVVVGAVGVLGWRRFGQTKTREGLRTPSPTEDMNNRATMLQNVEDFWLKGVLDPALEAGTFEMGLSSAPGAVLRHKDYGDYELPANANILAVFNDLNRELLILGAPGGGKTVLLLQLAKELIGQARQDANKAIPVVFNLSSWAAERKPLADWLVDELRQKYQVPKKVATSWVDGEKLLLLLDGLDEVAEQYRNQCVDTINAFRQQYRTVDLAICSRIADYNALTNKLDMRGAIVLEPLNQTVIDKYLDRPELTSLRQVMISDKELQEMSRVPFLLNAMAYAYAGATSTNLQFPSSDDLAKARRTHLFDWWAEKRLMTRQSKEYTPSKVQKWLGWLVIKMTAFNKIIFYIEELQPKWLARRRILYRIGVGLLVGLTTGLTIGVLYGLSAPPKADLVDPFSYGLVRGLIVALVGGLIIGQARATSDIELAESLRWRFSGFWGRRGFVIGFGFALLILLIRLLQYDLISQRPIIFLVMWVLALSCFCAFIFGLVSGILFGIQSIEIVTIRSRPNQGIRKSAYNALLAAPTFGWIAGAFLGPVIWLLTNEPLPSAVGTVAGPISGLMSGLWFGGGQAVIKHLILRLILWRSGDAPWNYARFLEYCASAGLMRKVGGGYIFAHRYLMEYFAESSTDN